ncbi:MAG TPA: RNA 2',3'-cyclic phosphodiesterase [Pyrinomonadaceae bacterium]|nr:RNA 2',3'-cyclic phosphodiesterase [Pyrinomonadaceae bacterium]
MSHEEAQKVKWRIFCAIELPDAVREKLQDHIGQLRRQVPEVAASWSLVENIHLTLKFFGNVAVDHVAAISAAASKTVKDFSAFEIEVGGTGVFPRRSRPQVLWIGVNDPSGNLSSLQQQLENNCAAAGFPKEDRAYHPHLTIARIRKPDGARRLAETHLNMQFNSTSLKVNELIVFRSELSSKGSKYTALSHHQLTNPRKSGF